MRRLRCGVMVCAAGVVGLAVLAAASSAGAHAGDGLGNNVIHACVANQGGSARIVGPDGSCVARRETPVHWSIQGPQGPKGDTGATGLQGPKGDPGTLGSFDELDGLACTAPGGQAGSVEVTYRNGVARLRCLVAGVRSIDNGDGTITDLLTGLLWEKKVSGSFCLHCVNDDFYTWADAMGVWLDRLNGRLIDNENQGGFAGYTDWRLPTLEELETILDLTRCAPCIDPIFGPTASSGYWSASTDADNLAFAWVVVFRFGPARGVKLDTAHVRAVRGGP